MNAVFFALSKRYNSTYRPTATGTAPDTHVTADVLLKESTSVLYPVLSVNQNMTQYNYVFIQDLGNRYYFITDWSYSGGLWWASCEIDVLATYRTAVFTYQGYCLRSQSNINRQAIDELAIKTNQVTKRYTSITNPWIANLNAGIYVLGIINDDAFSHSAVSYYVLNGTELKQLKVQLMTAPSYVTADFSSFDISQDLLKALFNPYQYIASALFFPVSGFGGEDTVTSLHVGWWDIPYVNATRIQPTPYTLALNVSVPKHPQNLVPDSDPAQYYPTFLDGEGYTKHILHFPPFQDIVLDCDQMQYVTSITLTLLLDPSTGLGSLKVTETNQPTVVLAYTETQIGVPIQLAQMTSDITQSKLSMLSTAVAAGSAAIGKSSILSILGAAEDTGKQIISGIGEAASAASAKMLSSGSNGSLAAYFNCTPELQSFFTQVSEPNRSVCGYPSLNNMVMAALTGYTMMYDPHVTITSPGTIEEQKMINNLLSSGVYCEWS